SASGKSELHRTNRMQNDTIRFAPGTDPSLQWKTNEGSLHSACHILAEPPHSSRAFQKRISNRIVVRREDSLPGTHERDVANPPIRSINFTTNPVIPSRDRSYF